MIVLYIILGLIAYFLLGGFVSGMIDEHGDERGDDAYVLVLWPIFAVIILIYAITRLPRKLGVYVKKHVFKNWTI